LRFNGNITLALAGYNAGPSAVDRWMKDFSGKKGGLLEFIETIPYKETREYVGSIIRNYFWYGRKLNADGPKRTLDYFWTTTASVGAASPEGVPTPGPAEGPPSED